jgi:glycosyltransferase involved in cell wall biosynthesis
VVITNNTAPPSSSILLMIAALNEEEGIRPTLDELRVCFEKPRVLVVDGRSTDRTVEIAKDLGAHVIFQPGKGKGDAIATAIAHLKSYKHRAEFVVFIDADYTYPAEYLTMMIKILRENPDVGMVCGNRFGEQDLPLANMRNIFYAGNRFMAFTHNLLNGVDMQDPLTGLRVIRWELLRGWRPRSKGFDIEVELNHHVERRGFKIKEITIHYRDRLGEKKLKLRHGLIIFRRILVESLLSKRTGNTRRELR